MPHPIRYGLKGAARSIDALSLLQGDPRIDFVYRGDPFDNASVGWFVRAVDRQVPDWRDLFEVEFGAYPGLDCFNPDKRQP